MKRSGPLRRITAPQRRVALRPVGRKAGKTTAARRLFVAAYLALHPVCERCGQRRSTDVHELRKRSRGGSTLDPANVAALCRRCHEWTESEPAAALAEGWLRSSWS